jgi:hypothetical protein
VGPLQAESDGGPSQLQGMHLLLWTTESDGGASQLQGMHLLLWTKGCCRHFMELRGAPAGLLTAALDQDEADQEEQG